MTGLSGLSALARRKNGSDFAGHPSSQSVAPSLFMISGQSGRRRSASRSKGSASA